MLLVPTFAMIFINDYLLSTQMVNETHYVCFNDLSLELALLVLTTNGVLIMSFRFQLF